jgi:hypothetical protein
LGWDLDAFCVVGAFCFRGCCWKREFIRSILFEKPFLGETVVFSAGDPSFSRGRSVKALA